MSRLSKEARKRIYKYGVKEVKRYLSFGDWTHGLCYLLNKVIAKEYEKEGFDYQWLDGHPEDFPELVKEAARSVVS